MAADTEVVEQSTKPTEALRSPYAVLFEFEGAAVQARRAEYDALRSVLSDLKVKLTPHLFARHCINTTPTAYLPALLEAAGGKKNVSDSLVEDIRNGVVMFLASNEASLNPALAKLIKSAQERHMDVACLTGVKESAVRAVIAKWGGRHERTKIFAYEPVGRMFPRADTWLKLAKSLSKTPRQCVAVTGSHYSMRTALSAGMRCIVIPDEFTTFQDFSGADDVIDDANDLNAAGLLELVAPVKPFI